LKAAIIPARGGSKRIPRKNIKPFLGKPMIAYSIEAAKASGVFDRIIVTTDDDEIGEVAISFGAEVPFRRPNELSDDHALPGQAVAHAIDWLNQNTCAPSIVCCVYATAPLLRPDDIKKGLAIYEAGDWDYVFSATKFSYPIFRAFSVGAEGRLTMLSPNYYKTRSQDLPYAWHDAGQFYWGKPQAWLEGRPLFDERSTVIELPDWRVRDIDTEADWNRAEQLVLLNQLHSRS
jgi:N-acylneuraminate cytidylyltransferase